MQQTMAKVRVVEGAITLLVEAIGVALLTAMVIVVFAAVFMRYVMGDPLAWSDEAARFMLIWSAFLGAALGVRRGSHYGILLILKRFPPALHRLALFLIAAGMAVFMFILVRIGVNLMIMANVQTSPSLELKMSWIYAAIPVSGTLMLFYLLLDMIDLATTGRTVLGVDPTAEHEQAE